MFKMEIKTEGAAFCDPFTGEEDEVMEKAMEPLWISTEIKSENGVCRRHSMNETMTKEEVIDLLRDMQIKTAKTNGFFAGHVTQAWVIKDLLGKKIEELGGESIEIKYV